MLKLPNGNTFVHALNLICPTAVCFGLQGSGMFATEGASAE